VSVADPKPISFDDTWAIAKATIDDARMILRYRQHLLPVAGNEQLPNRLNIVWLYDSEPLPGSHGMPSTALQSDMERMENALCDAFEPNGIAILATVATGIGRRQWTWYCCDRDIISVALNDALASLPRCPIKIAIGADPDWTTYRQFLSDVAREDQQR
jgi:hypothetical protein